MITKIFDRHTCNGNVIIKCDYCEKEENVVFCDTPSIKVVIDRVIRKGWLHLKIEGGRFQGDWFDFCSLECYKKMVAKCGGLITRSYKIKDNQLMLYEEIRK